MPFEPGAQWTLANLYDVYIGTNLLTAVLPNTAIFVGGSVVVTCLATTFVFRQEAAGAPVAGAPGTPAAGNNGGKRP